MPQRIVQVDAFTDRPFSGNPAAVCVLPEPKDGGWMQNVALEMNLSDAIPANLGRDQWLHVRTSGRARPSGAVAIGPYKTNCKQSCFLERLD
jgi:hypothetical protein